MIDKPQKDEVRVNVIDFETTGLKPDDASIIEAAVTPLFFNKVTKASRILPPIPALFKPAHEMTPENIAVHHITPRELAARKLHECDDKDLENMLSLGAPLFLAAHNFDFERQWIPQIVLDSVREICTLKVAARIYHDGPADMSLGSQALRYRLGLDDLPVNYAMPPHRAGPDSYVTAHILAKFATMAKFSEMVEWTKQPRYYSRCPVGTWRGEPWEKVDPSYLNWIMTTDMDKDIKHAVKLEQKRRSEATQAATRDRGKR